MNHPAFSITPYSSEMASEWDDFVRNSKNATFIHLRRYMDYHSDRLPDSSLMIKRNGLLHSIFPATACDPEYNPEVSSHSGLTFASLLCDTTTSTDDVLTVSSLIASHYQALGYKTLVCRPVPHIYHSYPSEEELYALFRLGATLSARLTASVVSPANALPWRRIRLSGIKKALLKGLEIREEISPQSFWPLLEETLAKRHGAVPVHTLSEIILLHSRFPTNIRIFTVRSPHCPNPIAGTVIYADRRVARAQYIATSDIGRECGALDLLFKHLLTEIFNNYPWFDFGTSNLQGGLFLNKSLIYQKEGFGARTICYDTYTLPL